MRNLGVHTPGSLWPPSGARYFSYLSFHLNYLYGGLDVRDYHVTNILIHTANSLLVYIMTALTFKTPWVRRFLKEDHVPLAVAVSVVAAVLFAVHPVQTGAVTYISQRFASGATLVYLSSLVLYIYWRLGEGKPVRAPLYVLSLTLAVVAQMTKEIAFTLPFVICAFEFVFFEDPARGGRKRRILSLAPFLLTAVIIPLSVFAPPGGGSPFDAGTRIQQMVDIQTLSRYEYLVTQFRVLVTYLRLLVWPANQNLDYDYPLFHSLFVPEVLASLLFLLVIIAAAVYLFVRARRTGNVFMLLTAVGVFWFFITISVESSIIPIKDVIFEHRLYLPSVGAAIAFSVPAVYAVSRLIRGNKPLGPALAAMLILILLGLPLAGTAKSRNKVWQSEITLYEDVIKKSPQNSRAYINLGVAYKDAGRLDDAIEAFTTAQKIERGRKEVRATRLADATNNVANMYFIMGRPDLAIPGYREVLELRPHHLNAHFNLALACERFGCIDEAITHYRRYIELAPVNYTSKAEDARAGINRLLELKRLESERPG